MKLYPYNPNSESAKALAIRLGIKRIRHEGKPLQVRGGIINWGCSKFTRDIQHDGVFNSPDCVAVSVNKLETFNAIRDTCPIPAYLTSLEEAAKWLAMGIPVVERHTLTGHSGDGIRIVEPGMELQPAPLYVEYIPKKHEYRLHVFRDNVFFIQRKARNTDIPNEEVNWKIRNHGNGFIFAQQNVDVPDVAKQAAIMAIKSLGLDFGAIDMIYNERRNQYYILEVNTACGLTGTTLDKYVEVFKEFV
jgi:glutathione synthase/RimK-type ligase-like ATP-grasp enzyme